MMRALASQPLGSAPCSGVGPRPDLRGRPARLRVRVRFKDDGSTLVALFGACAVIEDERLASHRGVMALWLLPIVGSA
ncbi:hypothetical protein [Methylorubrum thiocyanatum]|uniref:Uncharacterized protein n=1 Tax=Methylorubrum thiocyanatum TaxID=47958 RepID=A0AA40V9E9_9HYPH|nr:hypothetical protein [Methylorubrum thiocyanatum]MBA8912059.1 hypothetical protein [Methylorubrum thiocyanatum]GJE79648.1 hypothetical protein CJNNKLLH_0974 [Methylorubrum thiocyanatum]